MCASDPHPRMLPAPLIVSRARCDTGLRHRGGWRTMALAFFYGADRRIGAWANRWSYVLMLAAMHLVSGASPTVLFSPVVSTSFCRPSAPLLGAPAAPLLACLFVRQASAAPVASSLNGAEGPRSRARLEHGRGVGDRFAHPAPPFHLEPCRGRRLTPCRSALAGRWHEGEHRVGAAGRRRPPREAGRRLHGPGAPSAPCVRLP